MALSLACIWIEWDEEPMLALTCLDGYYWWPLRSQLMLQCLFRLTGLRCLLSFAYVLSVWHVSA
jgi:hypothetical protein